MQPSVKQCVIADSSSDVAPKMIGDKRYTETADAPPVRRRCVVGERDQGREAEPEGEVER